MEMKFGNNFNFELYEFQRSRVAIENDYSEQFSMPSEYVENLHDLVNNVLQPARTEFLDRIYVLSGYRCERVNSHPEVEGSNNSDHLRAMAADVTCKNVKGLYDLIIALKLPYKQLIHYKSRNFLHVSYDKNDIKKQHWVVK